MDGKRIKENVVVIAHVMTPQDANIAGNVHGGIIMKHIDTAAGVVAVRHAQCNVVTASIDRLDFHHPSFIGDILTFKASINVVGRTSMEIGVRVEAEDVRTANKRHIASAYLTFVALDEMARPKEVPPLLLESDDDKRRNKEAVQRRRVRLAEKSKEKKR